jgi:hypothetical protein
MDPAIVVALITSGLALIGTAYTAYAQRRSEAQRLLLQARLDEQRILLESRLEQERAEKTKAELARELMGRYRNPLLGAAYDLQGRLWNIVRQGFLDVYYQRGTPDEQDYARNHILYVLAEYLGWVEIVRRDVQFLDLGAEEENRRLMEHLELVRQQLATDMMDPVFRVFRGQQRAIGELMMRSAEAGDERRECMGYANFVKRLCDDETFARWFARLRQDVDLLAREPKRHDERLRALQHALIDLIALLDPLAERTPMAKRQKL